jgi:hypothetical protein
LKVIFYFAFRFLKLFLFGRGRTYRTPGAARGRGQVKVLFLLKKKKRGGENIIIRQVQQSCWEEIFFSSFMFFLGGILKGDPEKCRGMKLSLCRHSKSTFTVFDLFIFSLSTKR